MKEFALRTLTSVVFVAVMVAGLLVPYAAGALFLVIMAQSMNEFYRMALGGSFRYVTDSCLWYGIHCSVWHSCVRIVRILVCSACDCTVAYACRHCSQL